ncbi:MAG: biotin--[Lachnospiraceae bacterium]|nr:biotin--[acetyl-CoA-carboxylase] ligase [Lachnospiraceae bacterium]
MVNFLFEKLDTVDSTNDCLTREVESGKVSKDKILIARQQTNGHGSNGRSFVSDNNVGIYFTLLHFYDDDLELKFITQKAAVAVYQVFKRTFDIELKIKWVNDLYYNDKKVCGILCRNLIKHKAVIIGVGIDLFENKSISDEIKDIAGYIFKDKKDLIAKLNSNTKLSKESCTYKNIFTDFNSIEIDGIDIDDSMLWEPDQIVIDIVQYIYSLIKVEGLPQLYIEKNIIKDEKVYEDCNLEC